MVDETYRISDPRFPLNSTKSYPSARLDRPPILFLGPFHWIEEEGFMVTMNKSIQPLRPILTTQIVYVKRISTILCRNGLI